MAKNTIIFKLEPYEKSLFGKEQKYGMFIGSRIITSKTKIYLKNKLKKLNKKR